MRRVRHSLKKTELGHSLEEPVCELVTQGLKWFGSKTSTDSIRGVRIHANAVGFNANTNVYHIY